MQSQVSARRSPAAIDPVMFVPPAVVAGDPETPEIPNPNPHTPEIEPEPPQPEIDPQPETPEVPPKEPDEVPPQPDQPEVPREV